MKSFNRIRYAKRYKIYSNADYEISRYKVVNYDVQNKHLSKYIVDGEERIVFFGDSITEINPCEDIYVGHNVFNRGISGDTSKKMLTRLSNVTSLKPSILVILIGTNDIAAAASHEEIIGYMDEVLSKLITHQKENDYSTRIIVQSIMPINKIMYPALISIHNNERIQSENKAIEQLCHLHGVIFADTFNAFTDNMGNLDKNYTYDGLHANSEGFYRMSDVMDEFIFSNESK